MIRLGMLICLGLASSAGAGIQVWTAPATLKILKTDTPQNAPGRGGGGGAAIELSAGRREVAAFQVAVRSDREVRGLTLAGAVSGAKLTIWREHYLQTTTEGERPDPLTPAPADGGMDLGANTTQPFFVEVEVPADARPGARSGKLEIRDADEVSSVAVELNVRDFELPLTPALRTAFGNQPQFSAFEKVPNEGNEFEAMKRKYYEILLEHGVSGFEIPGGVTGADAEKFLGDPRMTSFTIPFPEKDDELKAVVDKLRKDGSFKKGYFYLVDEPATEDAFERLVKYSDRLKRVVGADYKLVTPYAGNPQFKTDKDVYDLLDGKTTLWCYLTSMHAYRPDKLDAIRSRGVEIWNYVAWVPHSPYCNFLIGMSAMQHRMLFWQEWKYRTTGLLYWSTDWWANNEGGTTDPWKDMATVKWASKDVFGDGSLLYPGKPVGHDGPLPSLRLKLIRQGLQDYDYLKLASEKAGKDAVDKIVNEQVKSWTEYQQDPLKLEAAKERLAELIEGKK